MEAKRKGQHGVEVVVDGYRFVIYSKVKLKGDDDEAAAPLAVPYLNVNVYSRAGDEAFKASNQGVMGMFWRHKGEVMKEEDVTSIDFSLDFLLH